MRFFETKFLVRMYSWVVSSVIRIAIAALAMSVVLIAASILFSSLIFGILTAIILFGLGYAAYRIRNTGEALNYPGIDRFFQQVPCYLTIQNKDMRIMRTNEFFRRDFGDRQGELCYKAYKGFDDVCPNCPVLRTFEDGQTHTEEETVITKNGEKAKVIVYTTPVINEENKVVGVMEMSTNITEVKKLQEQIEAGRKEYQNLFERVPCYISILDKDFRIKRVNSQFQKEFGDCTGKFCYEVYHKRNDICPNCHVAKTLEDGEIHSSETSLLKPDGTEARLIVYSSPILDENGEITAVMEMATDITEVKRLQRELTYMGRTIAVMAHRIKNIIMALEGSIFVLNTGMEDNDDNMVKKGWEMIERNVKKVSSIVKDLLYCSKEREMNFQDIDPVPIAKSVYDLFKATAQQSGIGFILSTPESLPPGMFDSEAIHSLLTNLITNAFDACVNDATEGKESHYVKITVFLDDNRNYNFIVEDNGAGIPGAVGECVFEDFFSTKGREGTGLGLLVAQKVAEEHGGTITFHSEEGKGTSFKAVIPPAS